MQLSRATLKQIKNQQAEIPADSLFQLPEKILQFGTGVLLRGLPDYFIDKANKRGLFNGRVVVVKSTQKGGTDAFGQQDGLYTHVVRGIEDGLAIDTTIINAAVSRVLHAAMQWQEVLACAHNPQLQIIISNTTEVGIALVEEAIQNGAPNSFPGKLLAFLLERFRAFGGTASSGMIVVPTELVPDNGRLLKNVVLELARYNDLPRDFISWLEHHNTFCSSLVDRIVPGMPDAAQRQALEQELGYTDELLIVSEAYRLWAIEGDEKVREVLSFAAADKGVVIAPDIEKFRELKLRLLNGTHTLSCGLAFLSGFNTVYEAMQNTVFAAFVTNLMHQEIGPAIPMSLPESETYNFGNQVLDRFRNPHLQHLWLNITMQYSSKMKMRVVPVLLRHYQMQNAVPQGMALGFAAYLSFTKPIVHKSNTYFGLYNGHEHPIQDDRAAYYYELWERATPDALVQEALADRGFWGADLVSLPHFATAVASYLKRISAQGAFAVLNENVKGKTAI